MLAIASVYKHTYGIGLFDCCREEISKEAMNKRAKAKVTNASTLKAIDKVTQIETSLKILKSKMQKGFIQLDEELFSESP